PDANPDEEVTVPTAAEMVAAAKQRIENLNVDEAAREVESGDALLVDIREPGERETSGAIAGAVEAPRGMLEFWADPTSPYHREEFQPDRRIILHCASGGRSALAAAMLKDMGYERVAHMDGGIKAWKDAGRPVEGGSG
ncbi:MAG TPA: rhodanese-like domain-containing protein, partial [Solirubrobacteraceae bacterium]|nr:rhodanese-like domain-containing protein [Solirubrobacteraceae bacterium]